jgi:hypothetical protein
MEKKTAQQLSPLIKDLSFKLRYGDYLPHLVGSSSDKNQEHYGDIDFFCIVSKPTRIEDALKEIYNIIVNIKKDRDFYFIELKVQLLNGKKIRFNNGNIKNIEKLKIASMSDIDFIKLDLVTREEYNFIDVSCIYKFVKSDEDLDDLDIEPLKEDMKEYINDHNYYKALKREYSINNITGNTIRNEKLLKLFNSRYGELYKKKSTLEAIQNVLNAGYYDQTTINKIEHNLKQEDMNVPLKNIDGLIDKKKKTINQEAKKYLV